MSTHEYTKQKVVTAQPSASDREDALLPYEEVALKDQGKEKMRSSSLANFLGCICCPLTALGSWIPVQTRTEAVVLHFGALTGVYATPGCHFINCWGRDIRVISTAAQSIDLKKTKILDKNGNPLLVSAIIVYHIVDTKRAAIDVANANQFVQLQATAVLKQIVSQYPYESPDGKDHEISLKTEALEVGHQLRTTLQDKIAQAGAVCQSFQLNEISFAPEIAANMLKRQAAEALVQARELIVKGAVGISLKAIDELERGGLKMSDEAQTRLVSNLLVVTCGEHDAQPTVGV